MTYARQQPREGIKMADRSDIKKLALTDPYVHAHISMWRFTESITWDEMMCALVVSLVEAKDVATTGWADCAGRMPPMTIAMPCHQKQLNREKTCKRIS